MTKFYLLLMVWAYSFSTAATETRSSEPTSLFHSYFLKLGDQMPSDYDKMIDGLRRDLGISVASGTQVDIAFSQAPEKYHVSFESIRRLGVFPDAPLTADVGDYIPPYFFGYTPELNELQVIDFDPQKKQYEFLVYKDFVEGKTPQLVKPRREFCLSCHQSETPHFARFPWPITRFGNKPLAQQFDDRKIDPNEGLTLFNSQVRRAAHAIQSIKVCDTGCGTDIQCKKSLLALAYLTELVGNKPKQERSKYYRWLNQEFAPLIEATWPNHEYAYASTALLAFDPLKDEAGQTRLQRIKPGFNPYEYAENLFDPKRQNTDLDHGLFYAQLQKIERSSDLSYVEDVSDFLDLVEVTSRTSHIDEELLHVNIHGTGLENPITPRPLVSSLPKKYAAEGLMKNGTLGACFQLKSETVHRFVRKKDPVALLRYFQTNPEIHNLVANQWPPRRQDIHQILRNAPNLEQPQALPIVPIEISRTDLARATARVQTVVARQFPQMDNECDSTTAETMNGEEQREYAEFSELLKQLKSGQVQPNGLEVAQNALNRSCNTCHDMNDEATVIRLDINNFTESLAYWGDQYESEKGHFVSRKIKCFSMPPRSIVRKGGDTAERIRLTPRERAEIVYWLETVDKNHLE